MLASTVQFSRYGRESRPSSVAYRESPGRPTDDLSHSAAEAPQLESSGAGGKSEVQATSARSLRTQQRAEADHHVPVPFLLAIACAAVLDDGAVGPANWSMFHP